MWTYGTEVCTDPRRVEALLRDLCGEHRLEISVIVAATVEEVPVELLASKDGGLPLTVGERLARQLQDNVGLSDENARWAVATWAFALDIIEISSLAPTEIARQGPLLPAIGPQLPELRFSMPQSGQQKPASTADTGSDQAPIANSEGPPPPGERAIVRRVQLGMPTRLPITQRELDTVKHLANAISSDSDSQFCLLRITPTFHEGKGAVIAEAYVRVQLETRGQRPQEPPKVWWMQPGSVEDTLSRSRSVQGSGGVKPVQASVAFGTSYEKYEPLIVAYGLQCSAAYWKFTKTRGRDIRGSHELEMVVWLPEACRADALIEVYATERKRKFGFMSMHGDVGTDWCSITLSQDDVQHAQIPQEWIW